MKNTTTKQNYFIAIAKEIKEAIGDNMEYSFNALLRIGRDAIKPQKYIVLSPDGFTIEFDKTEYSCLYDAVKASKLFCNRYTQQGYYSSNYGRIELADLMESLQVKTINQ